jgi:hypothetical protein
LSIKGSHTAAGSYIPVRVAGTGDATYYARGCGYKCIASATADTMLRRRVEIADAVLSIAGSTSQRDKQSYQRKLDTHFHFTFFPNAVQGELTGKRVLSSRNRLVYRKWNMGRFYKRHPWSRRLK